jgi:CDGSH-type Zn-finger protein
MKRLHELCRSSNKEWKAFRDGTHNDTVAKEGYFTTIAHFLEKHASR